MSRETIGFLGGSFDPVHFGHLKLATQMIESGHVDQVWFCPAWINPLKQDTSPTPVKHRLKMVQLAIEEIPNFHLCDLEARLEGPSYTVETLRILVQEEKKRAEPRQFRLILSDEVASTFLQWREPEEIVRLAPPLVGPRSLPSFLDALKEVPSLYQIFQENIVPIRSCNISSTEIRDRLKKGLDCSGLTSKEVLDYIYTNHLYFTT